MHHAELEVAGLVAAERWSGEVVPLDEQPWPTDDLAETSRLLDGCREACEGDARLFRKQRPELGPIDERRAVGRFDHVFLSRRASGALARTVVEPSGRDGSIGKRRESCQDVGRESRYMGRRLPLPGVADGMRA